MKHDETQAYARDIPRQRTTRKIHPMNTPSITFNKSSGLSNSRFWSTAFGALLLCASAVQAGEPQQPAAEHPLDLSVPRDANALEAWRKKHALERLNSKPYGSGYEARGLGETQGIDTDMTHLPPSQTTGNDSAVSGRSGAGTSGGGSGGGGGGSSGGGGSGGSGRGR